jgi:hypothetical protein
VAVDMEWRLFSGGSALADSLPPLPLPLVLQRDKGALLQQRRLCCSRQAMGCLRRDVSSGLKARRCNALPASKLERGGMKEEASLYAGSMSCLDASPQSHPM